MRGLSERERTALQSTLDASFVFHESDPDSEYWEESYQMLRERGLIRIDVAHTGHYIRTEYSITDLGHLALRVSAAM